MKILKRVIFYGVAIAIGVFFGFAFSGMSVSTDYYLNGKLVNDKMTSSEFIRRNIKDIKTNTKIDLNIIPSKMFGAKTDLLPVVSYKGEPGGGKNAIYIILLVSILISILIFSGFHYLYLRMNKHSGMDTENTK